MPVAQQPFVIHVVLANTMSNKDKLPNSVANHATLASTANTLDSLVAKNVKLENPIL